jgi:hypothetical protein
MRTLKIILTFLFFACILSCKKYGHGYIKGTVLETGTESTIEGATVILKYWKSTCESCAKEYLYDSTITDSQGKFVFYFKKKINYIYTLNVRDKNHFELGWPYGIDEKKSDPVIHVDPFAYLKIHLIKTSNSNNSFSCYEENIAYYHHDGSPVDTVFTNLPRVRGNHSFDLNWTIHYYPVPPNPNEYTSYSNKVYINKGDTLTYLISYN